ncbi:sensor histidine kinase [Candidatus Methanoperedens nitratireducens]|nr:ATP-binding protein [Candidatus Methanoperedens nitroreducens]
MKATKSKNTAVIYALSVVIAVVIFILDLLAPLGMAVWLGYLLPLIIVSLQFQRSYIYAFAVICTIFIALGYMYSPPGITIEIAVFNSILAVLVLWSTAILLVMRKQAEGALQRAYGELELRVQERTAELARANKALKAEVIERKRVEEELRLRTDELARSNAELEQFAYVASHDLQEPLRMVSGFIQLLDRRYKGKLDKSADEFIAFIVDGVTRMQRMIDDLLAYSRVGTRGKPFELTNCEDVFDQAVTNLKVTIEENGAVVTHDPLPTIMADASQIARLFQNLISNGIKFRGEEVPRVHVSAKRGENEWFFSVQDNGIGIAPEFFGHLFQIFQREYTKDKYPGTGIGLATCKRIVERHGGRIWAESEVGRGSTFYFTIPVRRGELQKI